MGGEVSSLFLDGVGNSYSNPKNQKIIVTAQTKSKLLIIWEVKSAPNFKKVTPYN